VSEAATVSAAPTLAVAMTVRGPFGAALRGCVDEARNAIEREILTILVALGVPGGATVELIVDSGSAAARDWIDLRLEGHRCRYPETLLRWILAYVAGRLPEMRSLEEQAERLLAREEAESRAATFLAAAASEVVKLAPSRLLGSNQLSAYVTDLAGSAGDLTLPQPESLWPALRAVLDARASIGNHDAVCEVLRAAGDEGPDELRERLLDALLRERVELQAPAGYAPRVSASVPNSDGLDLLGFAAEGLLLELGVAFPPFAFAGAASPDVFAVTLNHLPTLPTRLLKEDECLVNDTAERLALVGVEARTTVNPATEQPASIAPLAERDRLEAMGLTTWDPPGFLILTLADALRRHAGCFVTTTMIDAQLDELAVAAPMLVDTAAQTVPRARLTAVARALVSEQVSIQDLRAVLERLVDLPYTSPASGRWGLLDDPPFADLWLTPDAAVSDAQLVRFARAGLRRAIVHKQSRGTATLVVYLLDPQIEQRLREDDGQPGEAYEQRLLDAVGDEIPHLPPTAMVPAILTQGDVRAAVRAALHSTYPRIPVLSYDELTADLNIQPVARITLAEPDA
jgi:hypothetical protein